MKPSQFYETQIFDADSGLSFRAIVVPTRSFAEPWLAENVEQLAEWLGLAIRDDKLNLWTLSITLESAIGESRWLANDFTEETYIQVKDLMLYVMSAPVIPFEHSPLGGESLGSLLTAATGAGLGAVAAYVVVGHSPILLILAPGGMILFGAAAGIAKGLESGLKERIERLVSGQESSRESSGENSSAAT